MVVESVVGGSQDFRHLGQRSPSLPFAHEVEQTASVDRIEVRPWQAQAVEHRDWRMPSDRFVGNSAVGEEFEAVIV
jgi:hypothetical protein